MATDIFSCISISKIAEILGATEPALRLLISILIVYPLALFHRKFLYGQKGSLQHIFFVVSGIAIGYFNYGFDIIHALIAITYTYVITKVFKGSTLSLQLAFVLNVCHLLLGYYCTETNDYDIKWTMPHCVLVLRLIGYAFNVHDGTYPDEKLSKENRDVCLRTFPNFLEYCGYMIFPASFLVGPQFPYKRYQNFVNGTYRDSVDVNARPKCVNPAFRRLGLGLVYLSVYQIGSIFFTETFLLSVKFWDLGFISRMFYLAFWARMQLYKYVSCWLITEGSLILFSISHNGKDPKTNQTQWNGCENVKLLLFETTTEFNHYIQSFNTNTNHWSAQYIYKRLKFLGNRYLSQLFTLVFLAMWHGFHTGYYVSFAMEFIVIVFEKDLRSLINANPHVANFLARPVIKPLVHIILRLYTFLFMGWCLAPFVLLTFSKYWNVYASVYYIGFITFVPWLFVYRPLVNFIFQLFREAKPEKKQE